MDNPVYTMLTKDFRLTKKEFSEVFKKGRTFQFADFVIKYTPSSLPHSRFAISCGLKISKKATQRNLLRRRLYAIIHLHLDQIIKGDYIVITKQSLLLHPFSLLEEKLVSALRNIHPVR